MRIYIKEIGKMKKLIGVVIIIASIAGGVYLGGWILFIKPILDACAAFDTGTLTSTVIVITILKCIFASVAGGTIAYIGVAIGSFIASE